MDARPAPNPDGVPSTGKVPTEFGVYRGVVWQLQRIPAGTVATHEYWYLALAYRDKRYGCHCRERAKCFEYLGELVDRGLIGDRFQACLSRN